MTNNNLIFRDKDTNSALERVEEKLGPDAYILEINNVGNFVEIKASLEPPKPKVKSDKNPNVLLQVAKRELDNLISADSSISKDPTDADFGDKSISNEISSYQEHNLFLGNDEPQSSNKKTRYIGEGLKKIYGSVDSETQGENLNARNVLNEKTEINPRKANISKIDKEKRSEQENFNYGDLITLGFCKKFIKEELGILEFEGSVSREKLIYQLVSSIIDSNSEDISQFNSTIVLLGAPGSGKSTLLGKLMHQRGAQSSKKPNISHITCERLFESDRLRFYSKLFNFQFKRHKEVTNEISKMKSDLVEVDWAECTNFVKFYREFKSELKNIKPILVVSGETNSETFSEILKVSSSINRAIITKCDYGRVSVKNLMLLYKNGIKLSAVSGDRAINDSVKFSDTEMVTGFCEYCVFS